MRIGLIMAKEKEKFKKFKLFVFYKNKFQKKKGFFG